ncbi:replication factor C large subunit [Candidatus Micrarchaeota archaeon]|nr:replication factor C large subunit [Candidatus Micrarchaeota archaeon]
MSRKGQYLNSGGIDLLLTDKYAPKKLDDVVGNNERLGHVRQWILKWMSGKNAKPLLIWGPPGVGKTSIAYTLKEEYDLELLEMNASELRSKKRVDRVLGGSALASTLFGAMRLVLIDDADVLAGRRDSGGSSAITRFLREAPCPIIVTATDIWDKKFAPIRNECDKLDMKRINKASVRKLLKEIANREDMEISPETIAEIAERSNGDLRAALNDLQTRSPSQRTHEKDIFQVVRAILKARTYAEAREAIRGDIDYDSVKLWLDENIPNEYQSKEDIASAYEALSMADLFDGRIGRTRWSLLKYSIDLSVAGVALAKDGVYRHFTKYSFPGYLRNMARTVEKRAMLKSIGRKIGRKVHTNARDARQYLPLLKEYGEKHAQELMDFYEFDEGELAFIMGTSVSRIKKKAR